MFDWEIFGKSLSLWRSAINCGLNIVTQPIPEALYYRFEQNNSHKKSPEKFPGLLSHSRKANCKNLLKMRGINHREHAVQIEAQPHPAVPQRPVS